MEKKNKKIQMFRRRDGINFSAMTIAADIFSKKLELPVDFC
jgi:hypothetical protein